MNFFEKEFAFLKKIAYICIAKMKKHQETA